MKPFFIVVFIEFFTYCSVLLWEVLQRAICAYPLNEVPVFSFLFSTHSY